MEPLGRPPIPVPFLVAGKLALFCCWIFPLTGFYGPISPAAAGGGPFAAGILLYAAGTLVGIFSFSSLGTSLSVGLPASATGLKTGGTYRISRNPIYLAAYLLCAGSCVLAPMISNLLLFGVAAVIHHQIILREERFLEERFGKPYREYRSRVPRYVGTVRRAASVPEEKGRS